jgi:hypothetical protein
MLSYLRPLRYDHIVSCVSARDVLRFLTDLRPKSMIIFVRAARPRSVVNMTEHVELRGCRLRSRHPSFETSSGPMLQQARADLDLDCDIPRTTPCDTSYAELEHVA